VEQHAPQWLFKSEEFSGTSQRYHKTLTLDSIHLPIDGGPTLTNKKPTFYTVIVITIGMHDMRSPKTGKAIWMRKS